MLAMLSVIWWAFTVSRHCRVCYTLKLRPCGDMDMHIIIIIIIIIIFV